MRKELCHSNRAFFKENLKNKDIIKDENNWSYEFKICIAFFMLPTRTFALIFFLTLVSTDKLLSQETGSPFSEIKGKILNTNREAIEFATIALFKDDSTYVTSGVSDFNGRYSLKNIDAATYWLRIDHIEYKTFISEGFIVTDGVTLEMPEQILEARTNELDEVLITKKKRMIEVRADKIIFNVTSSPSASGSNGLDLLKMAPGVTLDLDNQISLLGKNNVQVYLNGVQSRLSGNDLTNFLQSLTSDTVESIEIISNPGAQYEAEGTGGIINIRLKKSVATGFNGNVTSSFTKGEEWRYSNNVSLNLGTEKIQSNFDITQSYANNLEFFNDRKQQNNAVLELDSREEQIRDGFNVGYGLESKLSDAHYVGMSGRGIFNNVNNDLNSTTNIFQVEPLQFTEILSSQVFVDGPSSNYLFNGFHIWTLTEGSSITTNLSAGLYNSEQDTDQPNTYFEPDGTTVIERDDTAFSADTDINLWSVKIDYEKDWEKFSVSSGFKYARIRTFNMFSFFNVENQIPIFEPTLSNDFNYTEKVVAGYANINVNFAPKWTLNAGLRVENTDSRGQLFTELDVDNNDVPRNYTDFFPNVSLSFDDQEKHSFSISVGRRITRPNYQDLNPFERPTSQLVVWKGNPFLNPNYIINYQTSYSFKNKLIITPSYSETTGFFARIVEITGDQSTQIIPRNMEKATLLGVSLSYQFEPTEFWDLFITGNASRESFKGNVESTVIDITNTLWNYRIQNTLKLPLDILMDVTFTQRSRWIWRGSVFISGTEGLSFGIRKNFLNKKLQVRITGADILRTENDYPYTSDYGGINLDGVYSEDSRRFGMGLTYNFGDNTSKEKIRQNALDEELERIEN